MLAGVRVIECSLLGPAAITSHLVDLGAEVIKVESPAGDYGRKMTWPLMDGTSLLHLHVNRGKQSLVLEPQAARGDRGVRGPGARRRRRGRGHASRVPGQDGPRVRPAQGAQPEDRDVHDLGVRRHRPVPEPARATASPTTRGRARSSPSSTTRASRRIPDQANIGITAGPAFGAIGILAALVRAEKTGEGACMEIAQSDSSAYFDWYRIETWKGYDDYPDDVVTGNPSDDYERRPPGLGGMWEGVRYQYYESSDGHILFMASEQSFWKNFCEGVDRMDLFEKWPGKTIADHARGNKELQAELRDIFRTTHVAGVDRLRRRAQHHHRAGEHARRRCAHDPQFQDRFRVDVVRRQPAPTCCCSRCTSRARSSRCPTKAPEVGRAHRRRCCATCSATTTPSSASLRDAGALG